ncbi:MAG: sulfatase [Fuerstiella sp.]|nr:sulfatase [Fuerstiella sp.]MCP4853745.1 sulfatase [Fuerstiella sp.]
MRTIAAIIILLTVFPCAAFAEQPARHRNIVFFLIDDLRYDTFGFMEHPFVETPHIDALADKGVQFTNAFVTTSLCSPSRASFLTGQYMHNHKVVDNADRMPQDTQTFPQLLQKADYETAFIGKWHMGGSSDAKRPGFDHWVSFRGQGTYAPEKQTLNVNGRQVPRTKYMTDELTEYSTRWLDDRNVDQPFLLYLSHKGVHGLYDPAPRHRDRYQDAPVTVPATMANTAKTRIGKPMWVQDQRNSWHGVEFPYHGRANQSLTEMYRHYCEMILSIDDSVGQVMKTLRQKGLDQQTMIVFTSDGGHLWGEHGLIDKRCAYEESIRIPLLASCPDLIPPDSQCGAVVTNIDIAPTFLTLAGVTPPAWMDGRSLVHLLQDPSAGSSDPATLLYEYYWEPSFPQTPTTFAVRGSQYKLIQYHGLWDTDELYDITTDPQETRNLINEPTQQKRVAQLRRQLYEQLKATNGLAIPLGSKRNHGSSQRSSHGSKRAEFPPSTIQEK